MKERGNQTKVSASSKLFYHKNIPQIKTPKSRLDKRLGNRDVSPVLSLTSEKANNKKLLISLSVVVGHDWNIMKTILTTDKRDYFPWRLRTTMIHTYNRAAFACWYEEEWVIWECLLSSNEINASNVSRKVELMELARKPWDKVLICNYFASMTTLHNEALSVMLPSKIGNHKLLEEMESLNYITFLARNLLLSRTLSRCVIALA